MKLSKYLFTFMFFPLLLMRTCAKESEETYDENGEFPIVHYGKNEEVTKDMAIENWEMFVKHSQNEIEFAESNLFKLNTKIEESDDYQKNEWMQISNSTKNALTKLKKRRINRYAEFQEELKTYDKSVYTRNADFEKEFEIEMSAINGQLDGLFEKIFSVN